jgi:hypothetical protein
MTRAQALRVLASAEGVSEKDRRTAQLMLAGPEIWSEDQHLLARRPKRIVMRAAVAVACAQMPTEAQEQERAAMADLQGLAGGLR